MGADYYESESKVAKKLAAGEVPLGVGENCVITNAIIDKNAGIGKVGPIEYMSISLQRDGRMAVDRHICTGTCNS
eukprot:1142610-Pelagomonas_calceolata.AAC.3